MQSGTGAGSRTAKQAEASGRTMRMKPSFLIIFLTCAGLDPRHTGEFGRSRTRQRKDHWTGVWTLGSGFALD